MNNSPEGFGPLADTVTGGPIDDPSTADRANPRWADRTSPKPDAQPMINPDGSPNVTPPRPSFPAAPAAIDGGGTPQDQAAQELPAEPGSDNIRDGVSAGQPNPALAEGGEG